MKNTKMKIEHKHKWRLEHSGLYDDLYTCSGCGDMIRLPHPMGDNHLPIVGCNDASQSEMTDKPLNNHLNGVKHD